MKYTWTEKGTRFNNKDYHFSMEESKELGAVIVSCQYGNSLTDCVVSPDQELYWQEILDEMKEVVYNHNYK
ncbi:hypothetical protein [Enterococcus phage VFW]|nr:hypothetical protein [Enterococcus phage VFW]